MGNTNLMCIMTQRTEDNKFNTFVFSMANSIKFEPNVVIVTQSKSSFFGLNRKTSQKIIFLPLAMTEDDMRILSDYFDMVIFDRFMRYFDSRRQVYLQSSAFALTQDAPKPRFAGYFDVLGAVEKTFDLALKMFSSSSKTEIVQSFTKAGFSSYDNTVLIMYYLGVPDTNIGRLKEMIIRNLQVPDDKLQSFADYIDFADIVDSSSWNNYQSFLRTDNSGGAKSIQLFFNFDQVAKKYNVFVTDVKTQFQIADDIFVMKKSKSTFGGLFQKETIDFKRRPHIVTAEDAEILMTFFDVIALKKFQATLQLLKPIASSEYMLE